MNEVQQKILEIFIEIDKICKKHNLRYYAIGGTCIGAVRHQGFIPWDDDIDIAMPGRDYEAFMKIARKELPEPFELIAPEVMIHRSYVGAKVHNINTTFVEEDMKRYQDSYSGIYVDILPLYGLPENKVKRTVFAGVVNLVLQLNYAKQRPLSDRKTMFQKILYLCLKPFTFFVSYNFYIKLWKRIISKYDFDSAKYTGYLWTKILIKKLNKRIFKKAWFDNYVELPFENIKMRCPCNWNAYLSKQFDDYMKLPPESERIRHSDGAIVDVNQSYKVYQHNND